MDKKAPASEGNWKPLTDSGCCWEDSVWVRTPSAPDGRKAASTSHTDPAERTHPNHHYSLEWEEKKEIYGKQSYTADMRFQTDFEGGGQAFLMFQLVKNVREHLATNVFKGLSALQNCLLHFNLINTYLIAIWILIKKREWKWNNVAAMHVCIDW